MFANINKRYINKKIYILMKNKIFKVNIFLSLIIISKNFIKSTFFFFYI